MITIVSTGSNSPSSGSGTGGTVDITVGANGAFTGVTINDDGSGYAASEVLTITNANASGINTVGNIGAADASRTAGTYNVVAYSAQNSGTGATFNVETLDTTNWYSKKKIIVKSDEEMQYVPEGKFQ